MRYIVTFRINEMVTYDSDENLEKETWLYSNDFATYDSSKLYYDNVCKSDRTFDVKLLAREVDARGCVIPKVGDYVQLKDIYLEIGPVENKQMVAEVDDKKVTFIDGSCYYFNTPDLYLFLA